MSEPEILQSDREAEHLNSSWIADQVSKLADRVAEARVNDALRALATQREAYEARIAGLESERARLLEVLSFDCTGFPGMEGRAVYWANKISGPKGGAHFHPDPVMLLEICEDIAKQALAGKDG